MTDTFQISFFIFPYYVFFTQNTLQIKKRTCLGSKTCTGRFLIRTFTLNFLGILITYFLLMIFPEWILDVNHRKLIFLTWEILFIKVKERYTWVRNWIFHWGYFFYSARIIFLFHFLFEISYAWIRKSLISLEIFFKVVLIHILSFTRIIQPESIIGQWLKYYNKEWSLKIKKTLNYFHI